MRFVLQGAAILSDLSGEVDLLHGRATIEAAGHETQLPVTSIEMISVSRGRWTLYGSSRDEELLGGSKAASVTIFARGGSDVLAGTRTTTSSTGDRASTRSTRHPATTDASPWNG